jgi:hypothetical protein
VINMYHFSVAPSFKYDLHGAQLDIYDINHIQTVYRYSNELSRIVVVVAAFVLSRDERYQGCIMSAGMLLQLL